MRRLLILIAAFFALSVGKAEAAVPCTTLNVPSSPFHGQCLHWPDGDRASQTPVNVTVWGAWGQPWGHDSSTFRNSWGDVGCGAGNTFNFNVLCGELLKLNVFATAASYVSGGCPLGSPTAPVWRGGVRDSGICVYPDINPSYGSAWNCGGKAVDLWIGCNAPFVFLEYVNNAWVASNHIAESASWVDMTAFLSHTVNGQTQPNYNWPYQYRRVVKHEIGCHEGVGHALGANHGGNTNCMQPLMPDNGNPIANNQANRPFLYDAATSIDSWHNHNDGAYPNYAASTMSVGKTSSYVPWKLIGKKGVKVVQLKLFQKPKGKPNNKVVYVQWTGENHALLTTSGRLPERKSGV